MSPFMPDGQTCNKPAVMARNGVGHPSKAMRYVESHGWLKFSDADKVEGKYAADTKNVSVDTGGDSGEVAGSASGTPDKT